MEYEEVRVTVGPINEEVLNIGSYIQREPSIFEMINLIADFPLKHQIILMVNLLTCSGYTEKEISNEMKIPYIKYRQLLSSARKEFKNKKINEL